MAETTKAKATAAILDFTNVKDQSGINSKRIPAGDYAAIITKVEDAVAKDKIKQWVFHIKVKDRPSSVFAYYCKHQENQLWKLRNLFIAAGKTVPKSKAKIDPNQVVGKLIGITVEDHEHENKEYSQITGVFPASELGDISSVSTEDDDEADYGDDATDDDGSDLEDLDNTQAGASDDEDEAEEAEEEPAEEEAEEDEADADPYAGLDRAELKKRVKALNPEFTVYKSTTDDDLKAALAKLEAPKPAAKAKAKAAAEISDDDLDDINIDDL